MASERGFPLRILAVGSVAISAILAIGIRELVYSRAADDALKCMDDILENALPSVQNLAFLRGDLRVLSAFAGDLQVIRTPREKEYAEAGVESSRAAIQKHFASYRRLPLFSGEVEKQAELADALAAVNSAALLLPNASDSETERTADERVYAAVNEADRTIGELFAINGEGASRAAHEVLTGLETARRAGALLLIMSLALILAIGFVAERRLARAEQRVARHLGELDAFAARAAHDLKGPLAPAVMAATLLRRGENLSERGLKTLDTLERSHQRLVSIIEGLLAFARASGAVDLSVEPIALEEVLTDVAPALRSLAEDERAELSFDVEPQLRVAAGKPALGSILDNLIRNALLYLGDTDRRSVTMRARSEGRFVIIDVSDTGLGIPPDVLARLFRPFERGSVRSGTGLGLATVKRLVEAHEGEVTLSSRVGLGTTVVVRLPRPGS